MTVSRGMECKVKAFVLLTVSIFLAGVGFELSPAMLICIF